MEAAAKRFFSSPYFAVVGASQDKNKFGYRSISLPPLHPFFHHLTLEHGSC